MGIREKLRHEETVVSDHNPYYATSQRVILLLDVDGREELWEIPYERLSSVEVVKLPRHKMMIAGTLLVISGVIMSSMGFITSPLAIVAGVAALIYGGIGKEAFYQFHANNMTKEETTKWRLVYWGSGSFIRTIETLRGNRTEF
jgi:hypothetical protein